ncbi:MAG: hypothetical protein CL764_02060 [Chloroflexi bacterium]|nr:hypothetical protein [Chloroflexota bacterium]|tara:strand:+ start:510 stop:1592 length:1083 start_codon:yes stop_codon:yes gene_type:complete
MTNFEINKSVQVGDTSNADLIRTTNILRDLGQNPIVTTEFSVEQNGILCGIDESLQLLQNISQNPNVEIWSMREGDEIVKGDVIMRIKSPYSPFAIYQTAISGILSSCSGWASAARECVSVSDDIPVVNFGASNIHPNIVGLMDYSSVIGGCSGCSSILGSRMNNQTPVGSMSDSLVLIQGNVVDAASSIINKGDQNIPVVILVGVLGDEIEEAVRVASEFPIRGIRIEPPEGRGGLIPELIVELREKLDQIGKEEIDISINCDITPDEIGKLIDAEDIWLQSKASLNHEIDVEENEKIKSRRLIQVIGIGRFIASASPFKINAEIKEIDGKLVSKRGIIPGYIQNKRLEKVKIRKQVTH